ncbi:cupin domain-containing protein [Methylocella sp. CPCC 101449]|jgi:quercetin dioxygenase-like cupin family protein|uniref:cupin domain-containing protein n=1 Tax=Methylocella sp. CPCC 101449 TaxID=2987531 RepID=UPI000969F7EB|nr:cupin domain-containing protein [Methylocella sp. CPCC 101449]MBN9083032.1 cupin domain-containing protein [Hyphomicrobiales bacterium]MDT2022262.1 cupin domain-containing protein [Methylocella sp. CPCC 101449]OJY04286.1 MAG: cupin [Rhizobiales bacterium 62-17]HEV2573012.1 cupin domain-containing protein [Beijerinckiaceae bacterium]
MDIAKIDWSKTDWTHVRTGVDRKGFSGTGATIAINRLMPGHEPRPHSHPHEQIAYIISGKIKFVVGGEEHILGPGSVLVVPPNVEHWGEVIGDEPVMNLDVFTPTRPEYSS